MNREQKLAKNTAILGVGTIFSSVFSFFMIPLFSRWLTSAEYGSFDVYSTYISLLMPFLTLACGEAVFRFLLECKNDREINRVLSSSWVIVISGLGIGTLVSVVLFGFFGREYVFAFLVLLISTILYSQAHYISRGLRRLDVYTISNIVYLVVMGSFVTLFVRVLKWGLLGILYGTSLGYIIAFGYIIFVCKLWKYVKHAKPDLQEIKEMIKYSFPLIPNTVAWWVVNVSDRTIISIVLGAAFNGIYAIANKLPSLCTTLFGIFHMSWQESAIDSMGDDDRNEYFNSILNRIIPICLSVSMCVISVNRYFYKWIWDQKYIDGYFHVAILICAVVFSFLSQFIGGVLVAEKKTKINGLTTVIAAVINVIGNVSLIRAIGLYSASVSTLLAYLSLFIMRVFLIRKEFTIHINMNSCMAIVAFICITATQFITSDVIGVAILLISICFSIMLNKEIVFGILEKITGRRDRYNEK